MKKALYTRISLYLLLAFSLMSCFKFELKKRPPQPDELPEITQEGLNTFGCLVDGEVWVPRGGVGRHRLVGIYQLQEFSLSAHRVPQDEPGVQSIGIVLDNVIVGEGEYQIHYEFKDRGGYFFDSSSHDYMTNSSSPGTLIISKLDREKRIISGTFEFDVFNEEGEKVEIREGRFDVTYF